MPESQITEKNKWIPSLEEYNPNISVEQWENFLQDESIFSSNAKNVFQKIYQENEISCKELSLKYGESSNFYNTNVWKTGEKIHKKTNCPLCPRENGGYRYWSVCCLGKQQATEKPGEWLFKLRPELKQAMENLKINFKESPNMSQNNQINKYTQLLETNKNLILHGAPGTGKSFFAKEIACQIYFGKKYNELSEDEKNEYESLKNFVQFHPSYDYTDFVEGLRPIKNDDGNAIGFERKDGIFKEFCKKALKNLKDSLKTPEELNEELSLTERINNFLENAIDKQIEYKTTNSSPFKIKLSDDKKILIDCLENEKIKDLTIKKSEIFELLKGNIILERVKDIREYFKRKYHLQSDSYVWALVNEIKKTTPTKVTEAQKIEHKNFVFIIDEINRGELSKIFGELFFSIDPGYRRNKGTVQTQYQNLVEAGDIFENGFFVPENVYIIGTMNDIDRSVESMDFAMRRRFVFEEITAEESAKNMGITGEASEKMTRLNEEIKKELGSEFCIGASYFLNVKSNEDLQKLWDLKLSSLLREYLRGNDESDEKFKKLENAYFDTNE